MEQTIELSTVFPMEALVKGLKKLKTLQPHKVNIHINQPETPSAPGTKPPTEEYTWRDPWVHLALLDISGRKSL